jgi:hypothetical protein
MYNNAILFLKNSIFKFSKNVTMAKIKANNTRTGVVKKPVVVDYYGVIFPAYRRYQKIEKFAQGYNIKIDYFEEDKPFKIYTALECSLEKDQLTQKQREVQQSTRIAFVLREDLKNKQYMNSLRRYLVGAHESHSLIMQDKLIYI